MVPVFLLPEVEDLFTTVEDLDWVREGAAVCDRVREVVDTAVRLVVVPWCVRDTVVLFELADTVDRRLVISGFSTEVLVLVLSAEL
jgi:hypothetical protein